MGLNYMIQSDLRIDRPGLREAELATSSDSMPTKSSQQNIVDPRQFRG
jgi:hypothetical protein